jgi:SulP family sulfate permease
VIRRKVYGNQLFSKHRRLPDEIAVLEKHGRQTTICELQGSLFFGTTDQLYSEIEPDLKTSKYVILDMRRVQSVDFTAAHMIEQIEARMAERKGMLIFTHLPPNLPSGQDLQSYFDAVGLVKPSRNTRIFDVLDDALEWTEERTLEEQHLSRHEEQAPLDLAEIDLLKGFSAEAIAALRACTEEKSFEPGQKVFKQGDTGDEIFLIRHGTVRIVLQLEAGKAHHLVTFARGDFFGDLAFLDRGMRSADAVAATRADLYVISRSRYDLVAVADPALGRKFFWRLARALGFRLRQTDTELRALHDA